MDTRHLGSVYEGLLEHQFQIAPVQYAAVAEDGGQVWKPADEVTVAEAVEIVSKGGLYVVNDEGERKATGAYYTPDYVVTYIVEETVGPLVKDIHQDLIGQGFEPGTQEYLGPFLHRMSDLKILDPAMGSGHFLTRATGYLPEEVMSEVRNVEAEMGVAFDEQYVRREIAKECIYGVDLNGMTVELAKLSMWLETLAADRPLAFLDHHFKRGNSLMGSDIEGVLGGDDQEVGQTQLTDWMDQTRQRALEHVMERFQDLLSIDNETLNDVKEMEEVYDDVRDDLLYQHLLDMANVHTAAEFGLNIPDDAEEQMAEALRDGTWSEIEDKDWFQSAQAIAENESFFHWELEFPVAFYDENGNRLRNAGFDAVIGNPPYVRQEQISAVKPYLRQRYVSYSSAADLYVYFIEAGLNLLSKSGHFAYITSNKFMRADYGVSIRSHLTKNSDIVEIVDFGELPVFDDASTFPVILHLRENGDSNGQPRVTRIKSLDFEQLVDVVEKNHYFVGDRGLSDDGWSLASKEKLQIQEKMERKGVELGDYLSGEINWGIKTGLNAAFVLNQTKRNELVEDDPKSEELIEPLVVGNDVRRYHIEYKNQYLIAIPSGWTQQHSDATGEGEAWVWFSSEYSAIAAHLSEHEDDARDRYDQGEFWWELRPCDYYDVFESPKLIYPEISKNQRFTIDFEGYYPNNKCFVTPSEDAYLLTLLNSTLLFEIAKLYVSVLGDEDAGGRLELRTVHIKKLPIINPKESSDEGSLDNADELVEELIEVVNSGGETLPIDDCLDMEEAGQRQILSLLGEFMLDYYDRRFSLNPTLVNYLGNYVEGPKLPDVGHFQPPSSNILNATTEEYEKLQVENVRTKRDGQSVTIEATARYKPENKDAFETDTWGYTATDYFEAFTLTDLTDDEAALVEAFVPVAVKKEIGGFHDNATKTISLTNRLKDITLPDVDDVQDDLERYIQTKERAEELDKKIEKTDQLIDEIVYELYGLTDEEIEIVEEAVSEN